MNKFIKDLLHRKSFIISIIIIAIFVFIAVAAPILTPYSNPYSTTEYFVAGPYAVPSWATIFPQYKLYPPNMQFTLTSPKIFGNASYTYSNGEYVITIPPGKYVNLTYIFYWKYIAPYSFSISFNVTPITTQGVQVNVYFINSTNFKYFLESFAPESYAFAFTYPVETLYLNKINTITVNSLYLNPDNSPFFSSLSSYEQIIYSLILEDYTLGKPSEVSVMISIVNLGNTPAKVILTNPIFSDKGKVFGILGTDDNGASVFAEFVYGTRFDLILSLLASILIVGIGLIAGLIAGYVGGKADLIINSITDFFLTIPGLPFIIVLETVLLVSGVLAHISKADLILLIIAGLSWMGTMKIIRSVTLSIKSRTFIEATKALGGNSLYIIRRHVLPNILGVVFAQIAYDVPTVILIESGLDFLGLGIKSFPTWGNMLGFATDAASSATSFAWWWVLPPGLGIVLLSIAFYYLGSALQDVLSPYRVRGE
ncbi:ABC transporter permease [Sulfolobus sp. S-194]|uniref:ABC transporter permease n=1 Tax=Sulfolobus sp. S-194 TaxID=2512240 RepID=UPI001436EF40|nr:ABC transporter permease [Sulfolobus sp. S-194]QIW23560.1 ABC transporter permease [Sulfolobus sp. S-194]